MRNNFFTFIKKLKNDYNDYCVMSKQDKNEYDDDDNKRNH